MRHWGFICANRLSTLACYSPADSADDADECSKLYYFAEKDSLSLCGLVKASQISVRLIGLHCADCLSTLECYFLADSADSAEEYSKLYYPAEKDMFDVIHAVIAIWGFVSDYLCDLREIYGVSLVPID